MQYLHIDIWGVRILSSHKKALKILLNLVSNKINNQMIHQFQVYYQQINNNAIVIISNLVTHSLMIILHK